MRALKSLKDCVTRGLQRSMTFFQVALTQERVREEEAMTRPPGSVLFPRITQETISQLIWGVQESVLARFTHIDGNIGDERPW